MGRKARHEEHENHERWLVSYADFITLLFAFFVVMYSISSVNEGKYRVLSDSLISAFRGSNRALAPIQIGQVMRAPQSLHDTTVVRPTPPTLALPFPEQALARAGEEGEGEGEEERGEALKGQQPGAPLAGGEGIARHIESTLAELIQKELIEVRRSPGSVDIEIKTSILFPSGSARLVDSALPVLERLSAVFMAFPNPVHVEGFTDNVPIATEVFPSNWELSAARAASVVHVCTRFGVRPERMVAVGYGEYRPVADNASADGRSRNRRVVLVIRTAPDVRHFEEPVGTETVAGPDGATPPALAADPATGSGEGASRPRVTGSGRSGRNGTPPA